ncbi:MAG: APC family permease [Ferroplasma sp.]
MDNTESKVLGKRTKTGMRRGMSTHDAIMFGVGGAVGSGILFAAAGGTSYAGPAVIISWILAAIFIVLVTLPFAEYSAMFPRSGISARIGYYSYGAYGGFLSGWGLLIWAATIPAIEAVAVSTYASLYFPFLYDPTTGILTIDGILLSIVLLLGFFALNMVGISRFGKFNKVLTWVKIGVVVAFIVILPLFIWHWSNFTSGFGGSGGFSGFMPSVGGLFIAIPASGILFSFGGYRQVADMAGEVKNPGKTMPKIIGTVITVQSLMYIGMAIVIVGTVSFAGFGIANGDWGFIGALGSPLSSIINHNITSNMAAGVAELLGIMVVVFFLFAIFSPGGTLGVYLTGSSRILFGYSEEDALPSSVRKTTKHGAPYIALIIAVVLAIIFLLPLPSWYALVDFVVVAAVANFAVASLSLPVLRRLYPDVERPFKIPHPMLWSFTAFEVATFLIYWATFPTTLYALGATLAGSIVFIYQANKKHFKGLNLKNSAWIPVYLAGLILLSYIGGTPTGGINLLAYPLDYVVLGIYGAMFFVIGLNSAPKEPLMDADALLDAKEDLEEADVGY